ncbi:MAG: DUF6020 family protein [Eubacterium sp.]|nr:DUF6020 family protein [Eubacterium sp.]
MKRISEFLFDEHPFAGPFLILSCLGLPWWFAFWPGTLQYDACGQLLQYLGVGKMTGHHPVPVTLLMGILLDVGRTLFHSDNAGIFIYTLLQFAAQCAVVSYGVCVFKRFRLPIWFCWMSLAFYGVFPLLPNWGISYAKDPGYSICFLLLTFSMLDAFAMEREQDAVWKQILWIAALVGISAFRNDGRYVAATAVIAIALFRRRYLKTCLAGAGCVILFLFLVEGVYMPLRDIPSGSVREALSVPLMQTAGYLKEYPDEVTEEERNVILDVFEVEGLREISDRYDSMISDRLKDVFVEYPDRERLAAYLKVWLAQLKKHPAVGLRVYWEHCSGYFDPFEKCYEDIIGWYTILDGQSRSDEYLDVSFIAHGQKLREGLENGSRWLYGFPLTGWLYHTGVYTWIMLGCLLFLMIRKRKCDLFVILPGITVLLVCTVSPLNASVRYYLPVMAAAPAYIGYCMKDDNRGMGSKERT